MKKLLEINTQNETENIIRFIKNVLGKANKNKVIIGLSGGIDSTTSLYLLRKSIDPSSIITVNLPYFESTTGAVQIAQNIGIPKENISILNIKNLVDCFQKESLDKIRLGNIMARVRMTILFDLAKKYNGLVCGTENKSEYYLGYFTRFGDEASDFEPIRHLYKNQVYQLAKHLAVPKEIIDKKPSADLWEGQCDEEELGFSYDEADPVLYLYFEKKMTVKEIEAQGFKKASQIIETAKKNMFKHEVPYHL